MMAKDADPELKLQYLKIQQIVRNINNNQQAGLVMPMIYDENTKQPLVKFELLKNEGGKAYDTTKIKDYYCKAILTALSADILLMGQSSTGSYALGNIKNTLSAIAIETKLKEICNVLNQHLIPLLAKLNDWDLSRLPTIIIDDLESVSLEDVSKYIQRIGAVGFLPRTPDVVNKVLNILGLEDLPVDVSLDDVLPDKTTRSGEGMEEGLNNGIGNNGNQEDESSNNLDNSA